MRDVRVVRSGAAGRKPPPWRCGRLLARVFPCSHGRQGGARSAAPPSRRAALRSAGVTGHALTGQRAGSDPTTGQGVRPGSAPAPWHYETRHVGSGRRNGSDVYDGVRRTAAAADGGLRGECPQRHRTDCDAAAGQRHGGGMGGRDGVTADRRGGIDSRADRMGGDRLPADQGHRADEGSAVDGDGRDRAADDDGRRDETVVESGGADCGAFRTGGERAGGGKVLGAVPGPEEPVVEAGGNYVGDGDGDLGASAGGFPGGDQGIGFGRGVRAQSM